MLTIVTAGTARYYRTIRRTEAAAERCGYGLLVYDLGGLGFGTRWHVPPADFDGAVPLASFKPSLLFHALQNVAPDSILAWLDGDAVLNNALDELYQWHFDLAVTLRDVEEIGASGRRDTDYLNTGVLFFRRTWPAMEILAEWLLLCQQPKCDQEALNQVVGSGWTVDVWRRSLGTFEVRPDGGSIWILPAREWNNWHNEETAKVLHYKGSCR